MICADWQELEPAERRARCRALAVLVRVFAGAAAAPVVAALKAAEADAALLVAADRAFAALPTLAQRRALSTLAGTL